MRLSDLGSGGVTTSVCTISNRKATRGGCLFPGKEWGARIGMMLDCVRGDVVRMLQVIYPMYSIFLIHWWQIKTLYHDDREQILSGKTLTGASVYIILEYSVIRGTSDWGGST